MKSLPVFLFSLFLLVAVAGCAGDSDQAAPDVASAAPVHAVSDAGTVVVYKSPTCGCCGDWITHMEEAGFEMEIRDLANLAPIKAEHGVAPALQSCHTALVDGYVVEGHVPADQVKRMLAERPEIAGISVPGMPIGSPGMDVGYDRATWEEYDVVAFGGASGPMVFAHVNPLDN